MSESASSTPESGEWDAHWQAYNAATKRNPAHRYRRGLIFDVLAGAPSGSMRLLDVGCGQGDFLAEASVRLPGADLAGIDFSDAGLSFARGRVPQARFFRADFSRAESLPVELGRYATHVVCSEVLEHLDDPLSLLRGLKSLLQPGATLVVTVPGGPRSAFDLHIGHRRHYSPAELEALMRSAGYSPFFVRGAGFPFFNLYRLTVILRGERLVRDVDEKQLSFASKGAMALFDRLFLLNTDHTRLGWQTFGAFRRT